MFTAVLTFMKEITANTSPMTRRAKVAAKRPKTEGRQLKSGFQTYPLWHSVQKSASITQAVHPVLQY